MPPARRSGVLDRALLARFPLLRRYFLLRSGTAVLDAALVIGQAVGIASLLATLAGPHPASVSAPARLVLLAIVLVGRATVAGWHRGALDLFASRWKLALREDASAALGARGIQQGTADPGSTTTLLTKGVDTVDSYLGTLGATLDAVVVPVAVLGAVLVVDWPSGLLLVAVLPLVPILLALAGRYTRSRTERQWAALLRLGSQFAEAIAGLTTLRVLGRLPRTAAKVREVADTHRAAVLRTLRVAFLSSLALETMATLSVALVAVPIGFRLLDGSMALSAGLSVLLLTPEAYRPLRVLGAQFHAAQDSHAMLAEMDRVLPRPPRPAEPSTVRPALPDPAVAAIELRGLAVGFQTPVLTEVSLRLAPGACYAVVGPSGAGKSTLLRTIAGQLPPLAGRIVVGGIDLHLSDQSDWINRIAVVPQRPHLFAGTVADNVRLGAPAAGLAEVWHALAQAGAADFVRRLPQGLDTELGERAGRLSAGQWQRVAVARALLRRPSLLLLDEPTARLDGGHEGAVLDTVDALAGGTTTVIVTHRPRVVARADAVIKVAGGRARLVGVSEPGLAGQ